VRRSFQKKGAKAPIHMVSAFAARQRLVLGQVKVAEKSNEIVAVPALLDMLAIEGAIVSIDAIGCQREIAAKTSPPLAGNLDDQDGVLGGQRNQQHQPDLYIELFARPIAVRAPTGPSSQSGTASNTARGDSQLSYCSERQR
jgi:hypothetical protein